jgi:phage terminase large subunit-like protein
MSTQSPGNNCVECGEPIEGSSTWTWGGQQFCRRSCRNIHWIEHHCIVPEGKLVGQPIKLRKFQKKVIRRIYDKLTRRAIISFARKNAKTALSAMFLLLHLCGPEARRNSNLFSSALSRDQAAILYHLAAKMVRLNADLNAAVVTRDTVKQLHCPGLGTQYAALSSDASTNFGLSPVMIVHDELGQVKGPRHPLYEALETATAAQEDPLSIIISTQAPTHRRRGRRPLRRGDDPAGQPGVRRVHEHR